MKLDRQSGSYAFLSGAIEGAQVWTAYAIVETLFSVIVPSYIDSPAWDISVRPDWPLTLLIFGLYPCFGFLLGGGIGFGVQFGVGRDWLSDRNARHLSRIASVLTVVLLYTANLINRHVLATPSVGGYAILSFSVSSVIAIALLVNALSSIRSKVLLALTNIWTASFLSLGLHLTAKSILSTQGFGTKLLGSLCYVSLVLVVALILQALPALTKRGEDPSVQSPSFQKKILNLSLSVIISLSLLIFLANLDDQPAITLSNGTQTQLDRPNVILIVLDTVRADHLSAYGYHRNTSPYLAELADHASLYQNAIATSTYSLPSHASLFTGMYASWHGAYGTPWGDQWGAPLDQGFETLGEILTRAGYVTAGVVANHGVFSAEYGLRRGFADWRVLPPPWRPGTVREPHLRHTVRDTFLRLWRPSDLEMIYVPGEVVNATVFPLLESFKANRNPFFLFLNYMDAHAPYKPPPPFSEMFSGKDPTFTPADHRDLLNEVNDGKRELTKPEQVHLVSQYDGAIAYLDRCIADLVSRLTDLGLYEDCLLIITSDHGESLGDKGVLDHGGPPYQEQVHVPLIVKFPRDNTKRVVEGMVSGVDVMPTILHVVGENVPSQVQGRDLRRLTSTEPRVIISEAFQQTQRAVYKAGLKFVISPAGDPEVYDFLRDPAENTNVYGSYEEEFKSVKNELTQWVGAVGLKHEPPSKPSESVLERLRALGYIR